MRMLFDRIEDWCARADSWVNGHPGVIRALLGLALGLMALIAIVAVLPALLVVVALALVVLFAMTWVREFSFLMHLNDDAFPGRNDKLIWAALMIGLAPVGLFLFRAHRRVYWPESVAKPAATAHDLS